MEQKQLLAGQKKKTLQDVDTTLVARMGTASCSFLFLVLVRAHLLVVDNGHFMEPHDFHKTIKKTPYNNIKLV